MNQLWKSPAVSLLTFWSFCPTLMSWWWSALTCIRLLFRGNSGLFLPMSRCKLPKPRRFSIIRVGGWSVQCIYLNSICQAFHSAMHLKNTIWIILDISIHKCEYFEFSNRLIFTMFDMLYSCLIIIYCLSTTRIWNNLFESAVGTLVGVGAQHLNTSCLPFLLGKAMVCRIPSVWLQNLTIL